MSERRQLSSKSRTALELMAEGQSYAQIVDGGHGLTYLDIFAAVEEALRLLETSSDYDVRMAAIKERYPRAYEKWSDDEEEQLRSLRGEGHLLDEIAEIHQRQPSAIESRLDRLGLTSQPPSFPEVKFKGEHPRSGELWTGEEEGEAKRLYREGYRVDEIARRLERTPFAVRVRLSQLGIDTGQDK
ncbi:MAG: hypothetical protein IT300_04365 [Dehalococcoidia bacterium]|nr:hypothetical protein [Dehalococcoidia bacterium]